MDILELIRTVDGGIAVAVLLFVGWRIEVSYNRQWQDLMKLINKLTNHDDEPQIR